MRADALVAHLLGPDHGLTPRDLERLEGTDGPEERWLLATHITHHDAPYPPARPHGLET